MRLFGVVLLAALGLLGGCREEAAQPPQREFALHLAQAQPAPGLEEKHDRDGRTWWVEKNPRLCCQDIRSAALVVDERNQPMITLRFSADATPRLAALTRENIGRPMAVLVDGQLHVAATVQSEIGGGQLALHGFSSLEEAQGLLRR